MSDINKCKAETLEHIAKVGKNINILVKELINRAEIHDASKLVEPELSVFASAGDLGTMEYNSEAYKRSLEQIKPALDHHYSHNRHHIQYHKNGINDMDLVDILELLCDWRAATERQKAGNIRKSIEINAEKYSINPQLAQILTNTVNRYF